MQVHFANVWQTIADEVGDRTALIHGDERVSWREHDEQAARLAQAFIDLGLQPDSKVALYLYNGVEYVTAQYAAFKMRGVPVNVNYRYTDNELLYLLDNSDAEVLLFHSSLGDRVERVLAKAEKLRAVIEVDDGGPHLDGALRWEEVLAAHSPAPRIEGQPEDIYMLYTGGTTGMPKGVMYTHGVFPLALAGFGAAITGAGVPPTNDEELLALGDQLAEPPVWLAACPQMHGTGMWLGTMAPLLMKGTVVTLTNRSFDPHELWETVEREGVTAVVIVGDAFAKPMLRALDEKGYEAPSLKAIVSSGVMWSTEVKEGLLKHLDVMLYDGLGSTEGAMGTTISTREGVGTTAKFTTNPAVKVVTEDGRIVEPGSDEIGMVAALSASLGYFKDPEKSARTFMVIDGVPHSLPGDWAKVAADGSLILLGRGSNCINTGGEKVFPEEVEEAVKANPAVYDCLVVGVEDERFGERVVAVASLHPGASADESAIIESSAEHIARYKLPKQVIIVDRVQRAPNGKADYPWAREVAAAASIGLMTATTLGPPRSIDELDAADRDLDEIGVAVVTGVLDVAATADARARLLDAADQSDAAGIPTRGYAFDFDEKNRRVFMLFAWDPVFVGLIQHPIALRYVRRTIGDFLISNFSANITGPGAGGMHLHADQYYVPQPWGPAPVAVNVAWLLDDFTDENGATRVIPGSHRALPDFSAPIETVPVEGPAGSIMVMDGRLWHQTGENRTSSVHRAALFGYYVQPWIRPQINWNAALPAEVASGFDSSFRALLGLDHGLTAIPTGH